MGLVRCCALRMEEVCVPLHAVDLHRSHRKELVEDDWLVTTLISSRDQLEDVRFS